MKRTSLAKLTFHVFAALLIAIFVESGQIAVVARSSSELKQMYERDQAERAMNHNNPLEGDWSPISKHDEENRLRVLELMKQDKIRTADDFFYAAMVMQHGNKTED